jgi:hypothetical protein
MNNITLTTDELKKLKFEYTFKNLNGGNDTTTILSKQLKIRDLINQYINDNSDLTISKDDLILIIKKLEYRWKTNKKNKWLFDKII